MTDNESARSSSGACSLPPATHIYLLMLLHLAYELFTAKDRRCIDKAFPTHILVMPSEKRLSEARKCNGPLEEGQYKFVAVGGLDSEPSKVNGSLRSHAIRAGLQKSKYSSKTKAAARSLRSPKRKEDFMSCFELQGGLRVMRNRLIASVECHEVTTPRHITANKQPGPLGILTNVRTRQTHL